MIKRSWIYNEECLISLYSDTLKGNHFVLVNFQDKFIPQASFNNEHIKFVLKEDIAVTVLIHRKYLGGTEYQCLINDEVPLIPFTFGCRLGSSEMISPYQMEIISSTTTRQPEFSINKNIDGDQCTFYAIKVDEYSANILDGKVRVIHRRFREFKELETIILTHYGATSSEGTSLLPSLHRYSKIIYNHLSSDFIRTRTEQLQSFLRAVTSLPMIHHLPAYAEFCGMSSKESLEYSIVLNEATRHSVFSICPTAAIIGSSRHENSSEKSCTYSFQVEKVVCPFRYPNICPGDVIIRISGASTQGLGFADVIYLLRVAERPLIVQFRRAAVTNSPATSPTFLSTDMSNTSPMINTAPHGQLEKTQVYSLRVPIAPTIASNISPLSVKEFKEVFTKIAENTSILAAGSELPQCRTLTRSISVKSEGISIMTPRSGLLPVTVNPTADTNISILRGLDTATTLHQPLSALSRTRAPSINRYSLDLHAVAAIDEDDYDDDDYDDVASSPTNAHKYLHLYQNMYMSTRELSYKSRGDVLRRQRSNNIEKLSVS